MPELMVLGTTSDAGKSTLVAALCRIFARRQISVAPFKPQNMALNSAVTGDGGEIGRAQALQARACFLAPHTDMNPVLIKPNSDTNAQIIIHGRALKNMEADHYHDYKKTALNAVLQSYNTLQKQYSHIFIEGAGSPAEINLREGDIANMGFAEEVDCPCILVADIDRGGVFAHLVGTLQLLSPSERKRIVGFVINRFRGDIKLLQSGLDWLENHTGKPVLAVLPYLKSFYLDAEDAITTEQHSISGTPLKVVVPVLPHISNHTDLDVLRLHPSVNVQWLDIQQPLPSCDLVILPGSKNVRTDLHILKTQGWQSKLQKHLRYGGKIFGICGGFQMLGLTIRDPLGVEGEPGEETGFAWIPMNTTLAQQKTLRNIEGTLNFQSNQVEFKGYEIHHGCSEFAQPITPLIKLANDIEEGFIHHENNIAGSYCHGLFDAASACQSLLSWAGIESDKVPSLEELREQQLERLATVVEQHFDWQVLNQALVENGFAGLDSAVKTNP